MSNYISFTAEQRRQARETDLAEFLHAQGEQTKRSGSELEWKDGSQKVTIRGNLWYNQYEQCGGDAVDFIMKYRSLDYPGAVEYLLNQCGGIRRISEPIPPREESPFKQPERNEDMRQIFIYLHGRRGISRDVLNTFIYKGLIYESRKYHNAVFVGVDEFAVPRHAHKRGIGKGSCYKGNAAGSVPEYSFHWNGIDEKLYQFESPIDLLSYITLHLDGWREHSYAAACGVGDRVLFQMLKCNANIKKVYLCFDNDEAGQNANRKIAEKLTALEVNHEILIPSGKDWNEDLLFARAGEGQS